MDDGGAAEAAADGVTVDVGETKEELEADGEVVEIGAKVRESV